MSLPSEHLEIHWQWLSNKAEEFGIALRIKKSSRHLPNTALKCHKLRQRGNPRRQHSVFVHNTNDGISFVPNSIPKRRKFPVLMLIVLHLLCASCVDVHYRSPQNVAVNIGERIFMNCSFDDTGHPCQNMVWTHYAALTSAPNVIFMGGKLSSLVSGYISIPDSNDGHCNLKIKTQTSVEGRYECLSPSTDKTASASLIILAGYPECIVKTVVNETGEYSNITCSVQYFGDWAPTMEWIKMTGQSSTSLSSSQSYTSNQVVSASILIPRNVPSSYRCIMKFDEQGRKAKTSATNVPDYEWTSLIFAAGKNKNKPPVAEEPVPAYNDGRGHGIGIGFGIGFFTCLCLCGTIFFTCRVVQKMKQNSPHWR